MLYIGPVFERANQLTDLRVAGLQLSHGFTGRNGGVSEGRYASLNLGGRWGDDAEAVAENYRRVGEAAGFGSAGVTLARQVHGKAVVAREDVHPGTEADAVWCRAEAGAFVGVLTADCVPILLADPQAGLVAAAHSGWRGTVADIAAETVRTLVAAGADASRMVAAIGPCIEWNAFEVGPEVAEQFPGAVVHREGFPKPHVDLVTMVRRQLEGAGLEPDHIERVGTCTHAHPERYFSYRRDGAGIGQHLSFVGFRAA